MVEYRILGPVEAVGPTGPVPLGGPKQRALLALLLLNAGSVVSSDRIMDELWRDQPPKAAASSVQNFVARLRSVLGPDAIVTRPPGYALHAAPTQIDAACFERLLVEARRAEVKERALMLREALALWRGTPLADCEFESFAQGEIRRLEELRLEATEERIEAELELGSEAQLVGEIEALVAGYPLRERLRAQLMVALYRAGRQAEALQVYHDARRALVDELGIEPGPQLQQLYRSILRQEVALAPAQPPARDDHLGDVATALIAGRLVFVLGAGAGGETGGAPGHAELAAGLARSFDCPPEHARDLAHVAEFVALTYGVGPLYDELFRLLGADYAPGSAQHGIAEVVRVLREGSLPQPLIVTTTLDVALERGLEQAGEAFDVVCYLAVGRHRGRFLHATADGGATVIEVPNAYAGLSVEQRPVILKALGGIDQRHEREWESFVVSEDDHIDYFAQAEIASVLPVTLAARLRRSHFLFLGYPLDEWSLRVFLHRIWGREKVAYRSWAIGAPSSPIEREHWRQRGIDTVDVPLDEYVAGLRDRIRAQVPA